MTARAMGSAWFSREGLKACNITHVARRMLGPE